MIGTGRQQRRRPQALHTYLPSKTAGTSPTDFALDSGILIAPLAGADSLKIVASGEPDGFVVLKANSGTGYWVPESAMGGPVIHLCGRHRFSDSRGSNQNGFIGLIAWSARGTTADSSTHFVIGRTQIVAQKRQGSTNTFTTLATWTYSDVGDSVFETEWVRGNGDNTIACRTPDGVWHKYTDSVVGTYGATYPCWEPNYNPSFTSSNDPELIEWWGTDYASANAAEIRYVNDLCRWNGLATYTVPSPPPPAPQPIGVFGDIVGTAGNPDATYRNLADTANYTAVGGELAVALIFNDDSNGSNTIPSGWTQIDSGAGASNFGNLIYRILSAGDTHTGSPGGTQYDGIIGEIWPVGCTVGGSSEFVGSTNPHVVPGFSLNVANGSSSLGLLGAQRNSGSPVPFSAVIPAGWTGAKFFDTNSASGAASQWGAMHTIGARSFGGLSLDMTSTGANIYAYEVLAP